MDGLTGAMPDCYRPGPCPTVRGVFLERMRRLRGRSRTGGVVLHRPCHSPDTPAPDLEATVSGASLAAYGSAMRGRSARHPPGPTDRLLWTRAATEACPVERALLETRTGGEVRARCARLAQDAAALPLGDRLGRGAGTVYRATDEQLDRPVALKVMRAEPGDDTHFVRRFTPRGTSHGVRRPSERGGRL